MHPAVIQAITVACNGGTWQQKWQCGWKQPTGTAANAGTTFGHGAAGVLIALAVIAVLIVAARAARGRKPAPASK